MSGGKGWRVVVGGLLRLRRRLVLRLVLLLLAFLLLSLLELLLFLVVFLLELMELLLMSLIDLLLALLLSLLVSLLLSRSLPFLLLLLFDLLALVILLVAKLLQLLLMLLIELRIHVVRTVRITRPGRRWTIVVALRIAGIHRSVSAVGWRVRRAVGRICGSVSAVGRRVRRAVGRICRRRIVHGGRAVVIVLRVALVILHISRIGLHVARVVPPVDWIVRRVVGWPIRLNVSGRAGLGRRSDLDVRTTLLHVLGLNLTDLRDCGRPAAIGLNGLLLLDERSGRRRRSDLRHHLAVERSRRWLDGTSSSGANNAVLLRRNSGRHRGDRSGSNFARIHFHQVASHGLSRRKGLMGSGGNRVRSGLVLIRDVGHVDGLVDVDVVVHVGDVRLVDDRSVGNVDILHVALADVIGRTVDVTRTEREPRDANSATTADSNADAEVRSSDPRHQGRCVDRAYINDSDRTRRARHPTPDASHDDPAAIVERRKTPRLIINPGPAPGRNPSPVAVTIGSPADHGGVRQPNGAVFGNGAPAAVVVEVFVADNVARDVAGRSGMVFAAITVATPVVKIVIVNADPLDVGVELVGPSKRADFTRMNGVSSATTGDFAFAVADNDDGGVTCFVDVNLVIAGTKNRKSQVRRIDFESFVVVQTAHPHVNGALSDADLRHTVVEIQERKASVAGETDRCGAEVQLSTRAIVGPKLVAGGHRAIDNSGNPVVGASRVERNSAARVAEAGDAALRVPLHWRGAATPERGPPKRAAEGARPLEKGVSHNGISP